MEGVSQKHPTASSTLFILDNSLSMSVRDTIQGASRFQVAKQLLDLLLKGQEGDWVALGTLDGDFHLLAPLTIDIPIARLMMNEVSFSPAGTNFLKGFQTLFEHFQGEHRPQQIVLVSDGEPIPPMDENQHDRLMKELKAMDMPLFTVGVGSLEGGIIPDIDKRSVPNFKLLAEMADEGGGFYYRIGDSGLIELAETIQDHFVTGKSEGALERVVRRLSPYFYLLAALFLLLALRLNPR